MKLIPLVLFVASAFNCAGCNSIDEQRARFVQYQNREIGNQFYAHDKLGMREVKISETESEFIPDPLPTSGCGIAWIVETRTRGPYRHPNGMTFQIEGVKKSWRFIGDPDKCLMRINWGPA